MVEDVEIAKFFEENAPFVPRGTIEKLKVYGSMLEAWSQKFNLVAASTLPQMWRRHFLDSVQLFPLLPEKKCVIADMGSGAGFPGLVLAACADHEVHLIESTGKKASFLEAVAAELKLNVVVHNERIEKVTGLRVDVVTARALKALPELISYAAPLMKKDSYALFLKGQTLDAELTEANKSWTFKTTRKPSLSDETGCVLILENLHAKPVPNVRKSAKSRR